MIVPLLAVLAAAAAPYGGSRGRQQGELRPEPRWQVLHEEGFREPVSDSGTPWVRDPLGASSPWKTDDLGDAGAFFERNGGAAFRKQLEALRIYRKRVVFGEGGWLTAELETREPGTPPSLRAGSGQAVLDEPDSFGGILIRPTKALPPRYRVEYTLLWFDFGGSRGGAWSYGGRYNGYVSSGTQTTHPWAWGPDKLYGEPAERWPDVRGANGFYFLAITDYPDPAPHNNVFIHTHRKVVMDTYNIVGPGGWWVCDPVTRSTSTSDDNVLHMLFLVDGTKLQSKAVMKTECGTTYGGENGAPDFVGAATMLPGKPYRFAIERDETGYTLEASGEFAGGARTLRYHRGFAEDGRPIWHHDQAAYPDYFIIGDPHINYYAGRAALTDLRLLVP